MKSFMPLMLTGACCNNSGNADASSVWTLAMAVILLVIMVTTAASAAWDLSPLGLDSTAPMRHLTLVGYRAILTILRTDDSQPYTLAEATWPDRSKSLPLYVKPFPAKELQTPGNCSLPQRVVASDWDALRNLFALDQGWPDLCPPKIIVYDVLTNKKLVEYELSVGPETRLNSLVVDPAPAGSRAYIGAVAPAVLGVFDLSSRRWWQLRLSEPASAVPPPAPTAHLVTRANDRLYLADEQSDALFSVDLATLRRTTLPTLVKVTYEGCLLGWPQGLLVEPGPRGVYLYYCLARDCVCVGWDRRRTLSAESHSVLLQSADLLTRVYQLLLDPQAQLWALAQQRNTTHCVKLPKPGRV